MTTSTSKHISLNSGDNVVQGVVTGQKASTEAQMKNVPDL